MTKWRFVSISELHDGTNIYPCLHGRPCRLQIFWKPRVHAQLVILAESVALGLGTKDWVSALHFSL